MQNYRRPNQIPACLVHGSNNPLAAILIFLLIRPQRPTLIDKIVSLVGTSSVIVAAIAGYLSRDGNNSNGWGPVFTAAIITYLLLVALAGVRTVGENVGVYGLGSQILFVSKRVFLYLLLPAVIITAILVFIAWRITGFR